MAWDRCNARATRVGCPCPTKVAIPLHPRVARDHEEEVHSDPGGPWRPAPVRVRTAGLRLFRRRGSARPPYHAAVRTMLLGVVLAFAACRAAPAVGPGTGAGVASVHRVLARDEVAPFQPPMTRPTPLPEGAITFTPAAVAARVSGVAVVRCIIVPEGAVRACRVVKSVPLMDDAIIAALYRHRTAPVMLEGRPIAADYSYTIRLSQPDSAARPPTGVTPPPNVEADAVLASLRPSFRECYAAGLAKRPTMAARFVYVVTIEPDGKVGSIWIRSPEGDATPEVLACLSTALRAAKFRPPRGGHPAALDVPITLAPEETDAGAD